MSDAPLTDLQREESIRRILSFAAASGLVGVGLRGMRGVAGVRRRARDDRSPRPFAAVDMASLLPPPKQANSEEPIFAAASRRIHDFMKNRGMLGKDLFSAFPKSRGDIVGSPGLLASAIGLPAVAAPLGYMATDKVLDARRKAEQRAELEAARVEFDAALRGDAKSASLDRLSRVRVRVASSPATQKSAEGGAIDTATSVARAIPLLAILAGGAGGGILGHRAGRAARKSDEAAQEAARRRMRAYVQTTPILLTGGEGPRIPDSPAV